MVVLLDWKTFFLFSFTFFSVCVHMYTCLCLCSLCAQLYVYVHVEPKVNFWSLPQLIHTLVFETGYIIEPEAS